MSTRAVCEKCLTFIPAFVEERDDGAWLVKTCSIHGESAHLIEPDIEFYRMSLKQDDDLERKARIVKTLTTTGIDVTRRCNVQCPHCYVEPDNRIKDAPAAELVYLAMQCKRADSIILMGAEPTMRADLPELIMQIKEATGKSVGIYTNAIRLSDEKYTAKLKNSGIDYACVSLHTRNYLDDERMFNLKLRGIGNLVKAGIQIHHVSFSLKSINDLDEVIEHALKLREVAGHIRIRSPQKIGVCNDEPMALSALYTAVSSILERDGHKVALLPSDNTPYHVNILVNGNQLFRLIRWPTLATADLSALDCPPYAIFDKEAGEVNLVLSFLMQEARRRRHG